MIVGITEFEPMDYKDKDDKWIGFDADMARLVGEKLGVDVEFVVIDWDNKVMELDSKKIDVVWNGMTLTDEVTKSMECTNAYCNNAQVVVERVKAVMNVFVWVIRGTPLMLQLIIIFYGPGLWLHQAIWSGDETGRITATVVAFVINYACYFSVIFRGGIEGVPAGQREAGQVLGMTKQQIFFKITLLQMIKRVVPPMSNDCGIRAYLCGSGVYEV